GAAGPSTSNIFGDTAWLGRAQQAQARPLDVGCSAADSIEGVSGRAVPGGLKKSTRCGMFLLVEGLEQRNQIVPERQNAVWVGGEHFCQCFIGSGVVGVSAGRGGLRGD